MLAKLSFGKTLGLLVKIVFGSELGFESICQPCIVSGGKILVCKSTGFEEKISSANGIGDIIKDINYNGIVDCEQKQCGEC